MSASVQAVPHSNSGESTSRAVRPALVAGALEALVVAVWFAVLGVGGAFLWRQLTTLPKVTRTGDGASLAPVELLKQVNIDGWFFLIAAVGGLFSGVLLLAWRRRDPVLMVVLVVLGAGLASWLMVDLGLALGPPSELAALRALPEGSEVPMRLKLHAPGVTFVWPIGAALGCLIQLWLLAKPDEGDQPVLLQP